MLPDGWQVRQIGDVLQKVSRPVDVVLDEYYEQIGVRSHGKGVFHKDAVTGAELGGKRVFWVEPECLVLNIVFAWEQAVAKTTEAEAGKIASHRFPMYRPKSGAADIDFLTYLFRTKRGKYLLGLASPGGAGRNKTLGQAEFERLEIALPPLAEQKKIAGILMTWDEAISTTEKLLANAEAQKRALMQQLLTGKTRLSGFEESAWDEAELGEVCRVSTGQPAPNDDADFAENGHPFIRVSCLADLLQGAPEDDFEKVTDATVKKYSLTLFPEGTVIFAKSGMSAKLGRVYRLNKPCYLVSHLAGLVAKKGVLDGRYLYYWLAQNPPSDLAQGDGFPSIKTSSVKSKVILLPSLAEQERIADCIEAADLMVGKVRKELAHLSAEKAALVQQLLTGKRRVSL